ncbi:MAG TPA: PEP-CTERM sorting domain-containing protein [Acidobacteriota bacterium]|nr:PEP-CTERM sorting domain-containing protein [Acidobacteriota bacterium]
MPPATFIRQTLAFGVALIAAFANGQIVSWDFNTATGSEASANATTNNASLATSTLSRGGGISATALENSFNSTGFTNGAASLSAAVSNNDYITFSIAPQAGFQVSIATLDAVFRRTSTGPTSFQWQYSLDAFATAGTNIGDTISFTSTVTNGVAQTQISLSGVTQLQSITGTAVFRLYAWGATGGNFALGRQSGNDLAIGGSISAVPEPSTYAALFGALALSGVAWRRRRSRVFVARS